MMIAFPPPRYSPGWALLGLILAVCSGAAAAFALHRRNRRILRRGAQLQAEIVAAEVAHTDGPYGARLRNVRLRLRFEGIDEHELEFVGYRLRFDDATALTPGATVRAWVLPEDLSEIRVARPDATDRILPLHAAPDAA